MDLARKLVRLLDDPELRAQMGEYGRRRVENKLQWKYEAGRLLKAYEALFQV